MDPRVDTTDTGAESREKLKPTTHTTTSAFMFNFISIISYNVGYSFIVLKA